jgi:hypothetical protein
LSGEVIAASAESLWQLRHNHWWGSFDQFHSFESIQQGIGTGFSTIDKAKALKLFVGQPYHRHSLRAMR